MRGKAWNASQTDVSFCHRCDLMYDFNGGYLHISGLHTEPFGWDFKLSDPAWRIRSQVAATTTALGSAPKQRKTSIMQVRSLELIEC